MHQTQPLWSSKRVLYTKHLSVESSISAFITRRICMGKGLSFILSLLFFLSSSTRGSLRTSQMNLRDKVQYDRSMNSLLAHVIWPSLLLLRKPSHFLAVCLCLLPLLHGRVSRFFGVSSLICTGGTVACVDSRLGHGALVEQIFSRLRLPSFVYGTTLCLRLCFGMGISPILLHSTLLGTPNGSQE